MTQERIRVFAVKQYTNDFFAQHATVDDDNKRKVGSLHMICVCAR